ncbi:uncharacterized protein N7473_007571 [Penicillium subrubescens]|uniref:uncharacterized protein n=1 Tax=Penicillium subrubescens TaxID=1316194 RepID=UPI0025458405|nr:uncharacterized protein N7473_007571 [Penicillium subrubescens]KAJ5891343.1 hypothetical protein N7473_007571 [Penicillium subrubescens]
MGVLQSLLHVILALQVTSFDLRVALQRFGLTAIISAGVVWLLMLPWIRRQAYEFCINLHIVLGLFTIVTLWIHLKNRFDLDGYLLIGSLGLLGLTTLIQVVYQVYRNGRGLAVAEKEKLEGAVLLSFTPTRPWKVRAGQYIYLRIPAVRLLSFAESHPLNILWWEENNTDEKASRITVLAKVESGFTRRLESCPYNSLRILLDGPYGKPKDTVHYDNFVFIATGIGISAQLAYLKELIMRKDRGYRLRRVCLVWQVDQQAHDEWICDYMNQLLDLDKPELVLRWALFVNSSPPTGYSTKGNGDFITESGRRGLEFYGKPDLKDILKNEVELCPRKLLLVVSADPQTRDMCRYLALKQKKKIDFFETEFQPAPAQGGFWAPEGGPIKSWEQ